MLKDSTLVGVFPSTPPSTDVAAVNMISTIGHNSRGKEVVEISSLCPYEALYDDIQSISNVHYDDDNLCNTPFFTPLH